MRITLPSRRVWVAGTLVAVLVAGAGSVGGAPAGAAETGVPPAKPAPKLPKPQVDSVSPSTVQWGDVVTISGRAFGATRGALSVGGIDATAILDWSDTSIRVAVPSGVEPESATVEVRPYRLPVPAQYRTAEGGPLTVQNYLLRKGAPIEPGLVVFRTKPGRDAAAPVDRNGGSPPTRVVEPQPADAGETDIRLDRYYVTSVQPGSEDDAILRFAADSDVEWAEPVYVGKPAAVPNDPFYATHQWGLQTVSAAQAWDYSQGSTAISIGIIDSGIRANHPDFAGKIAVQRDCTRTNCPTTTVGDPCGHGTEVAGVAAAATNNGIGIAGMGWNTRIRSYKVSRGNTCGGFLTTWVTRAIDRARTDGARVINMSFGLGDVDVTAPCPAAMVDAVNRATAAGMTVVTAAGNIDPQSPEVPGTPWAPTNCTPDVIDVASSTQVDSLADTSQYGAWVDVMAPGEPIWTTIAPGTPSANACADAVGDYAYCFGTSVAAPFVAGAAALLYERGADAPTRRRFLLDSADPAPCSRGIGMCGRGRLNAGDAFQAFVARDHAAQAFQTWWMPWYDQTGSFAEDQILVVPKGDSFAKFRVWFGDTYMGGGQVGSGVGAPVYVGDYTGTVGGPVRVVAPSTGDSLTVSQRTLYQGPQGQAFSETLATPGDWAGTETYFPWYDDLQQSGFAFQNWLHLTAPQYAGSATADVYVGSTRVVQGATVPAGGNWNSRLSTVGGPLKVVSTNGVPLLASQRALFCTPNCTSPSTKSFNEVMGQRRALIEATRWWYTWYDILDPTYTNDWVLVMHSAGTTAVTVSISVAGVVRGTQVLLPGQVWAPEFRLPTPVQGGPVVVDCTVGCGPSTGNYITTGQRVIANGTFSEVLGTPDTPSQQGSTATQHWMPWYDNLNSSDYIMIANTSPTTPSTVTIMLAEVVEENTTIPPGSVIYRAYVGAPRGPLSISGGVSDKLAVSQRVIWGTSFHETASGR